MLLHHTIPVLCGFLFCASKLCKLSLSSSLSFSPSSPSTPFFLLPPFLSYLSLPSFSSLLSSLLFPSHFLPLVFRLMEVSATFAMMTPTQRRKRRGLYEEYKRWCSGWVRGGGGVAGQNIDQYVCFVAVAKKVICTIFMHY